MAKFKTGNFTETAGINIRREKDPMFDRFIVLSLRRYLQADWGDTCEEDSRHNDYAMTHDERILASYIYDEEDIQNYLNALDKGICEFKFKKASEKNPDGEKIWIITEWDRSVTTILFPSEY